MRLIEYTARLWINCQRVLFRAGARTFQSAATHVLATGHLLAFNKTKPPSRSKVAADWKVRAPAHRNIVSPKPEKTGVVGSYAPRRTLSPVGLALSFVLLLTLFGCSHQPPNQLVVGMELNYPPFETVDQQGHAAGISVELAQELGKALHRELRIENIPFGGLI